MSKTEEMLYVGSCRYMKNFKWGFFPPRLHTTKEMIYFLENINNIKKIMKENPKDILNRIFGDITHASIKNDMNEFLKKKINTGTRKVILEVCSRKVYFYKDNIPVKWKANTDVKKNGHTMGELIDKYKLVYHELTDEEIEQDLLYIKELIQNTFNNKTELHIIPNINMKLTKTKEYIPKRKALVDLLQQLTTKHDIYFHDVGQFMETNTEYKFLEDVMPNGGSHYSKDSKKIITKYLNKSII